MEIDRGYIAQEFITNTDKSTVEFENPLILITDEKIEQMASLVPLLEQILAESERVGRKVHPVSKGCRVPGRGTGSEVDVQCTGKKYSMLAGCMAERIDPSCHFFGGRGALQLVCHSRVQFAGKQGEDAAGTLQMC